jgi:hypothetical protein
MAAPRKYEFTDETSPYAGRTLRRIRALVDICNHSVVAGDLGGFIESEENLDHADNAWVLSNGHVSGNGRVSGYGRITEQASSATRSDGYTFIIAPAYKGPSPVIIAGCRYFALAEARQHWQRTRAGTPLGEETFAIIDHLERVARIRGWLPDAAAQAAE